MILSANSADFLCVLRRKSFLPPSSLRKAAEIAENRTNRIEFKKRTFRHCLRFSGRRQRGDFEEISSPRTLRIFFASSAVRAFLPLSSARKAAEIAENKTHRACGFRI